MAVTLSDLAIFESLHSQLVELDALASDMQSIPGWQGLTSDTSRTLRAITLGESLRGLLSGLAEAFVWHAEGDVMEWSTYRVPASTNDVRSIEEIAAEELRIAASIIDAGDRALEVARLLGVRRLTGVARERIERILNA